MSNPNVNRIIAKLVNSSENSGVFVNRDQFLDPAIINALIGKLGPFYEHWDDWLEYRHEESDILAPRLFFSYDSTKHEFCMEFDSFHHNTNIKFENQSVESISNIFREILELGIVPYDVHCNI
jgi:hypothetical protein